MIALNISLKGKETIVQLYFKKYDDALKAKEHLVTGKSTPIRDDYGQTADINPHEVAAAVVTDMKQYFDAQGEMAIMQQRAQQDAQRRVGAIVGAPPRIMGMQ